MHLLVHSHHAPAVNYVRKSANGFRVRAERLHIFQG